MQPEKGVGGTPDFDSGSVGVPCGDPDTQVAFWGGRESSGPEPLTCGACAAVGRVGTELSRRSPTACPSRSGELAWCGKMLRFGVWGVDVSRGTWELVLSNGQVGV